MNQSFLLYKEVNRDALIKRSIQQIQRNKWDFVRGVSSYYYFKHPILNGKVTVPQKIYHVKENNQS